MIFIDIFCCALNGKYSALYINGRCEGEGGKEEEESRRKGGRGRREYQACACVCACMRACVRVWTCIYTCLVVFVSKHVFFLCSRLLYFGLYRK